MSVGVMLIELPAVRQARVRAVYQHQHSWMGPFEDFVSLIFRSRNADLSLELVL